MAEKIKATVVVHRVGRGKHALFFPVLLIRDERTGKIETDWLVKEFKTFVQAVGEGEKEIKLRNGE